MEKKKLIDKLVDKFLAWPLPESVCSDLCASMPGYPHRCGTNLMTADEAKKMLEHVLGGALDEERLAMTDEEGEAYMRGWFDRENQVPNLEVRGASDDASKDQSRLFEVPNAGVTGLPPAQTVELPPKPAGGRSELT